MGLGSGKPSPVLFFIIQHPEWREREGGKKKVRKIYRSIFEKRREPGVAGSPSALLQVWGKDIDVSLLSHVHIDLGTAQLPAQWG